MFFSKEILSLEKKQHANTTSIVPKHPYEPSWQIQEEEGRSLRCRAWYGAFYAFATTWYNLGAGS